jgi:hypothetical protein
MLRKLQVVIMTLMLTAAAGTQVFAEVAPSPASPPGATPPPGARDGVTPPPPGARDGVRARDGVTSPPPGARDGARTTANNRDGARVRATDAPRRGTSWGWLGLLGLAGLAGARGRNRNPQGNNNPGSR